ncbi:acyl-protein thioesterase [Xylaria flabelliformis]|nr:acyl-protein thioesterase [Xylaria flabelliformis]
MRYHHHTPKIERDERTIRYTRGKLDAIPGSLPRNEQLYIVKPTTQHTQIIILLHGFSANGERFALVSTPNIILGGLSQGCSMSLSVLLSLEFPLGGYIGMCGYLPFQQDIEDARTVQALTFERDPLVLNHLPNATFSQTALSRPIFLGHGNADEKKPYTLGEAAARTMRAAGYAWLLVQNA